MAEQGKYKNPFEIKSDHGSSSESVDEDTKAQTKSATLPRTQQDEAVYASMSPIPAQRNTYGFQKSPIPGSPTDNHEARSFFHVKDERDLESTYRRTEEFPDSRFGPPGPSLPPKITPPSRPPPLPTRIKALPETPSTEVPTSPNDPLYVTSRPTIHLHKFDSPNSTGPSRLSDAPSEEKKLAKQLLSGIGEKYVFVESAVKKYGVFNKKLSVAAEGIKDRITESAEESTRNIEWIEKTLLKDVRIRSEIEDHGAEIIHNALQTFFHLEKQVQELQTSNRGDQDIIGKSLDICENLRRLLRRDIVNLENKDVLLVENYCDLSVGTLLNKMITRSVGIVGLNEQNAVVVIDQRESLGICFGLWSKLINKCTKWEVMFQPKNTASQVVLSSTLGEDKRGSPVIVIGIGDTLYFVQTKKLFDKETGLAVRETETSVRLRLGFNMSSVACVERQPNFVCIGCNKQNTVTIYDCKGNDDQLLQQVNIIGGDLFHLSFATMFEGNLQFGVLLKTGAHRESLLSVVDQDGVIRQSMPRIVVKNQKVIPFTMSFSRYEMNLELFVLFFNQIASCQFYIGKFDYEDLTPSSDSVNLLSTNSRIPVNMTTLPGTQTTVMLFTNSETRIL